MKKAFLTLLVLLTVPASVLAARAPASFSAGRSLVAASSSPGNAYAAGVSVVLTAPVSGDFSAAGGSVITAATIAGDGLLFAGSINSRAQVMGDLRAAGWSISVEEPVAGDLLAFGYSVQDSGRVSGSVFIVAANTALSDGASGPVTIYGNNISLGGTFAGNVDVVASGHVALAPDTIIHGKLTYEAPEPASISSSAVIDGGVAYTNASYLPDAGTSRILALVSVGFFLFVRILGALILAGLLAGLFPRLAETITERAYAGRPRSILLAMLLGFAILVATPILLVLLLLTFVGVGLALLLGLAYALFVLLALAYAGILLGSLFARRYLRREMVFWHDGVLGMLALSFISLVPYIGFFAVFVVMLFSAGVLLQIFFHFAFPHETETPEML